MKTNTQFSLTTHNFVASTLFMIFGFISLQAQNCPALPFTNNSEILIEGYHSTMVRTETGYVIWGDMALPDGTTTGTPQEITPANGYNYSGSILLGTLGDHQQSGGDPQNFILSTGGLYVWGRENAVVNDALTTSSSFQMLSVTAPAGDPATGMPAGVNPADVQYMSASKDVLVLLTNSGDVYVLSDNDFEIFGDGSTTYDTNWHQASITNITNLKVTEKAIFAMNSAGQYFTWGELTALGDGTAFAARNSPTQMTNPFAGLATSLAVTGSSDSGHSMSYYALNPADDKIYTFGENTNGQLGIGNTTNQLSWVIVQNSNNTGDLENVTFLNAADNGPGHPAAGAITSDGTPYFWGDNSSNMLTGAGAQYNSPRIPDGFIQGTEVASYIGISGHYILVKKFGVDRPCFGGHKAEGTVGDGDDTTSSNFLSLDCNVMPILDYCFSSTTDSDLVTSKIVDDSNPQAGGTITFTLSVDNNGPDDAVNVQLTDILPAGLTFSGTANNTGGTVNTYNNGTGLWTIGDLSNGNSASIEIIANVDAGTEGTAINNAISGPASADNLADPITNTDDLEETINVQPDTDGDGVGDLVDLDDDNDGILDTTEDACAVLATFDIDSEGWYTINNNDNAQIQSNPASHSTDGVTSSDGCTITVTGISNQNIAGTSPTGSDYVVDSDPNGGANYLRSSNAGGIDYSNLIGGTFQYDAYDYKVGVTGNPGWVPSPTGNIVIYDTAGNFVEASFPLTAAQLTNWENGIWNTFSIPVDDANWSGTQQDLIDVLSDYDYVSILMEFVTASNTGDCNDVEYYAIDNVVFASSAGFGSSCDFDGDGIPNSLDLDSDNDGIHDVVESGGMDSDGNGTADDDDDNADNTGSNGIPTSAVGGNTPIDTGADGSADFLNLDSDGDGCSDANEAYTSFNADGGDGGQYGTGTPAATDGNGLVSAAAYDTGVIAAVTDATDASACDFPDSDGDGITDDIDIDDDNDGILDTVEGTVDTDGDGIIDALDLDSDNDGIPDIVEAGGIDTDGDGQVDYPTPGDPMSMVDTNNDGLDDGVAASPLPDLDSDGDGLVDRLDLDSDNDGIADIIEAGGMDTNGDGQVDYATPGDPTTMLDVDNDGFIDTIDTDDNTNPGTADTGGAALPDADTDGDSLPNRLDLDSDNDGIHDVVESGGMDDDGNGRANDDDDNLDNTGSNGIPTSAGGGNIPTDTGADGSADYLNLDSDGDGCSDANEAYVSANADGGDGGQYGTGTPAATGPNGLVTSAAYDTGVVAAVIDASDATGCDVIDTDGDGVLDDQEVADGTDPNDPCDLVSASITETQTGAYLVADCDGDGVINGTEIADGTNPEDPCDFIAASATLDPSGDYLISDCDGDGVTNGTELTDGTDPANPCEFLATSITLDQTGDWSVADCDGDLIPNGQEIVDGTNPNDPCSNRGGTIPDGVPCDIIIDNDLVGPQVDEGFFRITNIESYPNNTVRIYNRWGILVFETKGYENRTNDFRGFSNGRVTIQQSEALPPGIYFYIVEYQNNGTVKVKDGYLYVTR